MRPAGAPWEGAGGLDGGPNAGTPRTPGGAPGFGRLDPSGASPLPPGSEWAYGTPMSALSAGSCEASAQKVHVDLRSMDSEALREVREGTLALHLDGTVTPVMARAMASVNARARAREAASPAPSAAATAWTPATAGAGALGQAQPPFPASTPPSAKVSLDVRELDSEALRSIRETAISLQQASGRRAAALDEDEYQIRVSPVMARAMANVNARARARESGAPAGSPPGAPATPQAPTPGEAGRSPPAYAVTPNPLYEERSRDPSPRRSSDPEAPSHRRTLSVDLDRAWDAPPQHAQAGGEPLASPAGSLVLSADAETPGDAAAGKAWRQPGYAFPELNRGSRGFSFRPASNPRLSPRHVEGGEGGRPAPSPTASSQASSPDRTEYGEGVASPTTAIRAQLAQTPWLGSVQQFISSPSTGGSQPPPAAAARSRLSPRGEAPARSPALAQQHTPVQAAATGGFGSPLTASDSPAHFASPPVARSDTASSWTIAAGHPEPVVLPPSPLQPGHAPPASPARLPSPTREKTRLLPPPKQAPRKAGAGGRLLATAGLLLLLVGAPAGLYLTHEPVQQWLAAKWQAQPLPAELQAAPPPPQLPPPAGPEWWRAAKAAGADALQCRAHEPAWLCAAKGWLLRLGRLAEQWVQLAGGHTAAWDSAQQLPDFAALVGSSNPEAAAPQPLPLEHAPEQQPAEEPAEEPEPAVPEPPVEMPPPPAPEAVPEAQPAAQQEAAQLAEPQPEPAAAPEQRTEAPEQPLPEQLAPATEAANLPEEPTAGAAAAAGPARSWAAPLALASSAAAVIAALAWAAFGRPAAAAPECMAPEPSFEPEAAREASPEPAASAMSGSAAASPAASGLRASVSRLTRSVSRAVSREPSAAAEPGATWLPSKQTPGRLHKVESPPGRLAFRQMRGRTVVTDADGQQVGDLAPGAHQAEQQTPAAKPARRARAPAATEPARAKPPASTVRATRGRKLEPLAEAEAEAPAVRRSTRARARA